MTENCDTRNPLVRDGTSQQQRVLETLLPDYVSVDERSLDDLRKFAREYAKEIQFYDETNTGDGDWVDFFKKEIDKKGKTEPHYALFVTFLELFKFAQDDLNMMTQRHLDFYYREVLQLKEKPAVPDQVFIIFELAKHVSKSSLVKKGTKLKAGKDATGVELVYEINKDIAVNKAEVKELKAVFFNKDDIDQATTPNTNDYRIYSSPTANSSDGKGGEIETEEKSWDTFGNTSRDQAEVGFALASPILFLAEGDRTVTLTFTFADLSAISGLDLSNAFTVTFSGEEEWITPDPDGTSSTTILGNTIKIVRTITESQAAVIAYDKEVLLDPFSTKWPVVKIALNTKSTLDPYVYKDLNKLNPSKVDIQVDVDKVRNIIVQNDLATLDAGKPFQPFGNRPVLKSNFYMGSNEVFAKELTYIDIVITWQGLPDNDGGFSDYYLNYIQDPNGSRTNSAFKAIVSVLDKKDWVNMSPVNNVGVTFELFSDDNSGDLVAENTISIPTTNTNLTNIKRDSNLKKLKLFDNDSQKGFMRFELDGIDFGHHDFSESFTREVIDLAKSVTGATLPKEPYTPLIEGLRIDYGSKATIDLEDVDKDDYKKRIDQFFHVEPFGVSEINTTESINLLPQFDHKDSTTEAQKDVEGTLYVGIKDLVVPQNLSLLFQVAEGSSDPDLLKQDVIWSYMKDDQWVKFNSPDILSDSTKGLITSGIISFSVSKTATSKNTVLTTDMHWLRATVENDSGAIAKLIKVQAQAVAATFKDNKNDPDHLKTPLLKETISKLEDSDSSIDKLTQPYSSIGGKIEEQSSEFYTRISERLRHKRRGLTIWDYEHLILEEFPSIYKLKCLNHTKFTGTLTDYSELAPGHVTLIVISNLLNKNAVDPLKPKTSLTTLTEVGEYIELINPPCVSIDEENLHVKNPIFEEIKVDFHVKFHKDIDKGLFETTLIEDIKEFLSPWAFDPTTDIVFGGKIHKSVILNFVEERSYVDFLTCFKMYHIVTDPVTNVADETLVDEAIASTSASVLGSASTHAVNVLETDDCKCTDNKVPVPANIASVDECPPCDDDEALAESSDSGWDGTIGGTPI